MVAGPKFPDRGAFPLLTEAVADTSVGVLVIFLFAPIVYGAVNLTDSEWNADLDNVLVSVFPDSLSFVKNIGGLGGVVLFLGALVLGMLSRNLFWLIMSLSRWPRLRPIHFFFARIARWTLEAQYGYCVPLEFLRENFIEKSPFWRVGNTSYAQFRAELMKPDTTIPTEYWKHEEFIFFLHDRAYSIFLTALIGYVLYGVAVAAYLRPWDFDPAMAYFIIVLSFGGLITFALYRGLLWHGSAFVQIDEVLYRGFLPSGVHVERSAYRPGERVELILKNADKYGAMRLESVSIRCRESRETWALRGAPVTVAPDQTYPLGWNAERCTVKHSHQHEVEASTNRGEYYTSFAVCEA
jgi:hypothetical protein